MTFKGVYTALITPFLPGGELDEEGFVKLLKRQLLSGVHGIVILGTTGEAPTLSKEEKERIVKIARKIVAPPLKLIIGTGKYCTQSTIAETKFAERAGADAALVVAPYYNKPTQEGLFLHYQALAKATKLPLMLYNIAGRTGINIQTSTVKRLLSIPSIIGIKEASGSIPQIMDVLELRNQERPEFAILSGDDNLTLPLMALGGDGIISVISNLIPKAIAELYSLCRRNKWEEARALHFQLLPLFKDAFIETNPIPIKTLMNFAELPSGQCRLPLSPPTSESEKHLRHLHEKIKLSIYKNNDEKLRAFI